MFGARATIAVCSAGIVVATLASAGAGAAEPEPTQPTPPTGTSTASPTPGPIATPSPTPTPTPTVAPSPEGGGTATPGPVQPTPSPETEPDPNPTCGGAQPARPGGGVYDTCTFTDDFDGSAVDTSRWTAVQTSDHGFTTGHGVGVPDCYLNGPDNVSVSNGQLHLTSRSTAEPFACRSPYGEFLTKKSAASLVSQGKFSQTYGRFEFRAKFPANATPDYDSALWMYPDQPAYGAWPRSGEIDVAEWFAYSSYTNNVFPSVHYAGENVAESTGYACVVPNATSQFHTYALAWTETMMYFYFDDKLCYSHRWKPQAPLVGSQPFDQPFDLVMTQTGGWFPPAGQSVTMDVDWVRAWK
jgi:hypothetical protein